MRFVGQQVGRQSMSKPSSTIADHLDSPRNVGVMDDPHAVGTASLDGRAPRMTIYLRATDGSVTAASFQTFGCGYSIAACSRLTELVTGSTVGECLSLTHKALIEDLGGMPAEKEFCAELAVRALHDAILKLSPQDEHE